MNGVAEAAGRPVPGPDLLGRALDTERIYFEIGARLEDLAGAVLAWTPAFVAAPAASVIHRLEHDAIAARGPAWLAEAESRLAERGIRLARIYLMARHAALERLLANAGYACREELVFADNLPDPPSRLTFRPVLTEQDWARKRAFHEDVPESPDGHRNHAAAMTGLERHKCAHGMHAFLGEIDDVTVGAVSAVWGDAIVRIKNVVVHPAYRRHSIATELLSHVAALGRTRGIKQQCLVALAGGAGEKLYRTLGMHQAGSCFEWSRRLGRA